jgi:hypothetical protein
MATKTAAAPDFATQFEQAGFVVESQPDKIKLMKSNCVGYLERSGDRWLYTGFPYMVVHGIECELEDRGYQKFWYSKADDKRFPIRRVDLDVIHRFDEEIRYIVGTTSLYNESLGSTNARTAYDRLDGRPDR